MSGKAITLEPSSDNRWRINRNSSGKCTQRCKREMIRVCMRKKDRIDVRKLGHLDAGSRDPRQEEAELVVEIRIGEHAHITEVQ